MIALASDAHVHTHSNNNNSNNKNWILPSQHSRARTPTRRTAEDFLEGETKVLVEEGVDDGVEGGVAIAHPHDHPDEGRVEVALLAQRLDEGHEEEGKPADDEAAHHDAQRLGRALLLRRGDPLPALVVTPAAALDVLGRLGQEGGHVVVGRVRRGHVLLHSASTSAFPAAPVRRGVGGGREEGHGLARDLRTSFLP